MPETVLEKFLTPEAMLTPGVAGSMSMMIANSLQHQFNLPNGWSVLILSFVCGTLVWAKDGPLLKRSALYVLNSLVIFCTAVGAITLGATGAGSSSSRAQLGTLSLIESAYAQSASDLQAQYLNLASQKDALLGKLKATSDRTSAEILLKQIQDVDKKQTDVLNSIAKEAQGVTKPMSTGGTQFFAPLKF